MEPLFHFALALLSAGAPWLAAIIVVAIAVDRVVPIRLNLSIGDRSGQTIQPETLPRIAPPAYADRRTRAGHSEAGRKIRGGLPYLPNADCAGGRQKE
jgi:hypothetical protein